LCGAATMLPIAALRHRSGAHEVGPLLEDPPSLTFRVHDFQFQPPEQAAPVESAPQMPRVEWRHATSVGLQYAGRLVDGTQLPVEGPDWVTWNPATDSSPNLPVRLFGNERTIRAILSVLSAYRAAHPDAPRVVIGDISFRSGGGGGPAAPPSNGAAP